MKKLAGSVGGSLLLLAFAALAAPTEALSGCTGNFAAGTICGNPGGAVVPPVASVLSPLFDRNFGAPSAQGTVLNRGSSTWSATVTPVIGNPGSTTGSIGLASLAGGVATIAAPGVAGNTNFKLPINNGSNGYVLSTDGAGNTFWGVNSSGGTVTSVGLALPTSVFQISGSPVLLSGILTGSFINQTANTVFAGPGTGSPATPTFRSLVGADLPTPGLSALGGVEANTPVTHQWINAINTSGVPQLSQPAFTDISGTISPSQCTTPSTSTLGCIESYASVTSQWINAISNSGVPSSTQPGFADIAGQIVFTQFPSIANNTIIANASGSTRTPQAYTISSILDATIGSLQGDIIYRNASGWVVLAAGTSGQALETGGAGADPAWATVSGTGTVTSVATNNGITGGPITTTGTVGLATIATGNVLGYTGAGSGVPVATTPSVVLDVIGSTEGDILYRGITAWQVLAPGTNGQVLQTGGAGSTPSWTTTVSTTVNGLSGNLLLGPAVSSSGTTITLPVPLPQGRLTLQTGVPVMNTTQANKSTIFYDCFHGGNLVPIFNGTVDTVLTIGACEIGDIMPTSSTGVTNINGVFDEWAVNVSGTLTLCHATNGSGGGWASDTGGSNTARGTGYSQLDFTTRRFITNKNALAHCYNGSTDEGSVSSNRATYIGTFFTTAAGQTTWQYGTLSAVFGLFGVWNAYNRVNVSTLQAFSGSSAYSGSALTNIGNNLAKYVVGLNEDSVSAIHSVGAQVTNTSAFCFGYVGVDSTSVSTGPNGSVLSGNTNDYVTVVSHYNGYPGVGLHFLSALESSNGAGICTFFGSNDQGFAVQVRM